jgi:prepilin signal peptidase PulO-like enzyme (type II secretory pathway)
MSFDADQARWIIILWMTFAGAAIGSFMNVVVYRLPLRLSLSYPPSHCPKCKHAIRWYHNVPVFGWLWLRGRCYDCGCWIPIRYPLIEAITGLIFFLLAAFEFLVDGHNMPFRDAGAMASVAMGLRVEEAFGVCLYHLLLMCTLLCTALIEFDEQRPPLRLYYPALVIGILAPLVWPVFRPVPAFATMPEGFAWIIDGLTGMAMGAALGGLAWPLLQRRQHQYGMLLGLSGVGLYLGWQAVGALGMASFALYAVNALLRCMIPKLRLLPATMWLCPLTLAWILFWRRIIMDL